MNRIGDSADFAAAFGVSRETLGRLETYVQLLQTWQKTINLIAPSTLPDVWHRHVADSAQVWTAWRQVPMPASGDGDAQDQSPHQAGLHWLDLGSGAGFPGLVVGILSLDVGLRGSGPPFSRLTLIESDQRKAAFLREVVRSTGLRDGMTVDIVAGRVESPANHLKVGQVDVVSARALAPLPKLLDWSLPYFGPATTGLFLKGREAAAEMAAVSTGLGVVCRAVASATEPGASIIVVRRR